MDKNGARVQLAQPCPPQGCQGQSGPWDNAVTLWGQKFWCDRNAAPHLPWVMFGHSGWLPYPAVPMLPQDTVLSRVLAPDNEVASPVAGLKASLQALANLFSLCLGRLWP